MGASIQSEDGLVSDARGKAAEADRGESGAAKSVQLTARGRTPDKKSSVPPCVAGSLPEAARGGRRTGRAGTRSPLLIVSQAWRVSVSIALSIVAVAFPCPPFQGYPNRKSFPPCCKCTRSPPGCPDAQQGHLLRSSAAGVRREEIRLRTRG